MNVSIDTVRYAANLARLALDEKEASTFAEQLNELCRYVEQLNELTTDSVEATSHAVPLDAPQRSDELVPSLPRDTIMSQAPQREEEYFLVPKIIE